MKPNNQTSAGEAVDLSHFCVNPDYSHAIGSAEPEDAHNPRWRAIPRGAGYLGATSLNPHYQHPLSPDASNTTL